MKTIRITTGNVHSEVCMDMEGNTSMEEMVERKINYLLAFHLENLLRQKQEILRLSERNAELSDKFFGGKLTFCSSCLKVIP